MSYIFEALQKAEAERAGTTAPVKSESVVDLLQETEQRMTGLADEETSSSQAAGPATDGQFANARVLVPSPTDPRLVCLTDQGSLAAEKFRVLGLKLRGLRDQRKIRRIVVTGTAPEEGKSLVAANLALNQARSRVLKTLLVDGDLRRPTVAKRLGFTRSLPGLSECLRGETPLASAVYRIKDTNLWILPAGDVPENPLELMQSGRLPELLEQLGAFFDWIIIDTPPIVPVADTPYWIRNSDGVLVVIREGVSEKKVIGKAVEALDPAVVLGVVFNASDAHDHQYYYTRYGNADNPGKAAPAEPPAAQHIGKVVSSS